MIPVNPRRRREKVFGPGRAVPLDRNAKTRIMAYARAWGARHKQPGQHRGPITRAFLEVLEALVWGFHNSRTGCCFPSYELIAAKAECCRDTVYEALKVLEFTGVLTWVHRIARIQVRERDLFGKWASRWRVIRRSNAYVFRDPQQRPHGVPTFKSENPAGTQNQEIQILTAAPADPDTPLVRALASLGATLSQGSEEKVLMRSHDVPVPAS
jgi:Helix-turn-helix domain